MPDQKTCFVVMGFNKKTDYATGRTLDLNKTYRNIIKPAVEAAGVKCVRADEIVHSGVIDVPMYEQLLEADLVVADISTMNANAIYELGVRHALRPATTIVMGESRIFEKGYPFDLNHLLIRSYVHMGDGIDFDEVETKRKELTEAIETILAAPKNDSPVYVSLADLERPQRRAVVKQIAEAVAAVAPAAPAAAPGDAYGVLLDNAEAALQRSDFDTALRSFRAARELSPKDAHVAQRIALATYKSRKPDPGGALAAAREVLRELEPETSNDPETLGLWGAVHKRLFELTGERAALDAAVFAHEKGFYLKNDYYNGINLAFLLNVRAGLGSPAEAIADFVGAQRTRRRVAALCEPLCAGDPPPKGPALDAYYWVVATLAEALAGDAGQKAELDRAYALDVAQWMKDSTAEQLAKLNALLADSPLKHLAGAGG
jgi:tetratricopeptide (TPR) repeat protein